MKYREKLNTRESLPTILKSKASIEKIQYIQEILSALSSIICIINESNQVVFSNDILIERFGLDIEKNILGKRPGEFLSCENVVTHKKACGTSEKCEYCGAFNAIEAAWKTNEKIVHECKITSIKDNHKFQLDLEITVTPMFYEEQYMIVSIADISEKKHKELLERIFFHDILNIAGSLSGIIQLYPKFNTDEKQEYLSVMNSLTDQIIDEIKAQRQMILAEMGDLSIELREIVIEEFIDEIANKIRFHQVSINKNISVKNHTTSKSLLTDETLLSRILINMIKNALEAINENEVITFLADETSDFFRFSVHNKTFIPVATQLQIFKRSFSTKGKSRGLGTYSMKLLGEKFLEGKVGFTSTKNDGTTFYIDIPKK